MRKRWITLFGSAMVAGAIGGALLGPTPAGAVAREIIELQTSVSQLLQAQQTMQTSITQNDAVQKTLIQQSLDAVSKLSTSMGSLQKTMQDLAANSGARLDTMGTQVQGLSDNVADMQARLGRFDQKLTDVQNTLQSIDAKLAGPPPSDSGGAPAASAPPTPAPAAAQSAQTPAPTHSAENNPAAAPPIAPPPIAAKAAAPPSRADSAPPSADVLYSNGLRDINGRHYALAEQEFRDYLKYYSNTDLASNAQFYLGEIAYMQNKFRTALDDYNKVIENYPRSFKLVSARMRKGFCLAALGRKTAAIHELRAVVRQYPGTEEAKRAAAKLRELGAAG